METLNQNNNMRHVNVQKLQKNQINKKVEDDYTFYMNQYQQNKIPQYMSTANKMVGYDSIDFTNSSQNLQMQNNQISNTKETFPINIPTHEEINLSNKFINEYSPSTIIGSYETNPNLSYEEFCKVHKQQEQQQEEQQEQQINNKEGSIEDTIKLKQNNFYSDTNGNYYFSENTETKKHPFKNQNFQHVTTYKDLTPNGKEMINMTNSQNNLSELYNKQMYVNSSQTLQYDSHCNLSNFMQNNGTRKTYEHNFPMQIERETEENIERNLNHEKRVEMDGYEISNSMYRQMAYCNENETQTIINKKKNTKTDEDAEEQIRCIINNNNNPYEIIDTKVESISRSEEAKQIEQSQPIEKSEYLEKSDEKEAYYYLKNSEKQYMNTSDYTNNFEYMHNLENAYKQHMYRIDADEYYKQYFNNSNAGYMMNTSGTEINYQNGLSNVNNNEEKKMDTEVEIETEMETEIETEMETEIHTEEVIRNNEHGYNVIEKEKNLVETRKEESTPRDGFMTVRTLNINEKESRQRNILQQHPMQQMVKLVEERNTAYGLEENTNNTEKKMQNNLSFPNTDLYRGIGIGITSNTNINRCSNLNNTKSIRGSISQTPYTQNICANDNRNIAIGNPTQFLDHCNTYTEENKQQNVLDGKTYLNNQIDDSYNMNDIKNCMPEPKLYTNMNLDLPEIIQGLTTSHNNGIINNCKKETIIKYKDTWRLVPGKTFSINQNPNNKYLEDSAMSFQKYLDTENNKTKNMLLNSSFNALTGKLTLPPIPYGEEKKDINKVYNYNETKDCFPNCYTLPDLPKNNLRGNININSVEHVTGNSIITGNVNNFHNTNHNHNANNILPIINDVNPMPTISKMCNSLKPLGNVTGNKNHISAFNNTIKTESSTVTKTENKKPVLKKRTLALCGENHLKQQIAEFVSKKVKDCFKLNMFN